MAEQTDMFSGIYDNQATGRREVWTDGRLSRYARRNCVGVDNSTWKELQPAWGSFPDLPSHFPEMKQESAA